MNAEGFYRRPLPDPLIAFASPRGRELFREALSHGGMEGYFPLAEQFHTQAEPAFCGLGTLVVVLNALSIDPGRVWRGPWRWYSEEMLDCCQPLEVVKEKGLTLGQFSCLAQCNGARVERRFADSTDVATFRRDLKAAASSSGGPYLVANYSRKALGQTGDGHFSPIGGYHEGLDLALVLDVARFKYPPHWVPVPLLWEAMLAPDPATERCRGYLLLSQAEVQGAIYCQVSCEPASWGKILRQFSDILPEAIEASHPDSVEEVLDALFLHITPEVTSMLASFAERLDGSLASEHRQAVSGLLEEIRSGSLFGAVERALGVHSGTSSTAGRWIDRQSHTAEIATVLLLTCPDVLLERLTDVLQAQFRQVRQLELLPPLLRAEVAKVRSQMQALQDYCCGRDDG